MKKKPIPEPEPVAVAEPEEIVYSLKQSGAFVPSAAPVLQVLKERLTPILEKYEFDFFKSSYFEPATRNFPISEVMGRFDGGGVLQGTAFVGSVGGGVRVLNGEGSFSVFHYDDTEIPDMSEMMEECRGKIDGLMVSAFVGGTPVHCKPCGMRSFFLSGRHIHGYELPFVFGWKPFPKLDFVHADHNFTTEEIEKFREIDTVMSRHL